MTGRRAREAINGVQPHEWPNSVETWTLRPSLPEEVPGPRGTPNKIR
jgi:hypothetical protein